MDRIERIVGTLLVLVALAVAISLLGDGAGEVELATTTGALPAASGADGGAEQGRADDHGRRDAGEHGSHGAHAPAGENGHPSLSAAEIRRHIGDEVRRLTGEREGLYEVTLADGEKHITHGPDLHLAEPRSGSSTTESSRPPMCATTHAQHVLYGRPAGASDRYSSVVGTIRDEIARMNAILNGASLATGGPTVDYRVLCGEGGEVAVGSFTHTGSSSYARIVNAAKAAGFNRTDVNYTIFYDGGGGCGIGSFYPDERLREDNWNNRGGGYGISYRGCWTNLVPMHENAHNMGAVQYNAPNSTGSGAHCLDVRDVMCYSDGGDRDTGTWLRCSDRTHFDCGADDYFNTVPRPGSYLASHWNLGSRLNRFLVFDRALAPPGSHEAERSVLSGGLGVATSIPGYSGVGYAEGFLALGATAAFSVHSPAARPVAVRIRYANPGDSMRTLTPIVNGAPGTRIELPPTGGGWSTTSFPAQLRAGSNDVSIRQALGDTGQVALDYITVPADPNPAATTLVPGTAMAARSGRRGSWRLFKVEVPSGQRLLRVQLHGPSGLDAGARRQLRRQLRRMRRTLRSRGRPRRAIVRRARAMRRRATRRATRLDLYLRRGSPPDAWRHAARSASPGSREAVSVLGPNPDWWYVGVHMRQGVNPVPFHVVATLD